MNKARRITSWKACCLAGVAAACLAVGAHAQKAWPVKPVRLIVPSAPGGGTDASARFIAPRLGEALGQPVYIENRPGAATLIGVEVAARAAPDGYTLLMENSTLAILPSVRKNPPLEVLRGLAPITLVAANPQILVSHASLPTANLKQLIAFARTRPGKLDYAAGGYGGNPHMCMELLLSMTGMKVVYVPYKSGMAGITDVLAGQVPLMMAGGLSAGPHVRSGRLRAYGVTSARRAASMPDIPTIAEAGVPGYDATQWFGLFAPGGTPREIVARVHVEVLRLLKEPDIVKRFVTDGSDVVWSGTPEGFATYIREDEAKWAKVVNAAGIKPE